VLKWGRTIADPAGSEHIQTTHIAAYRRSDSVLAEKGGVRRAKSTAFSLYTSTLVHRPAIERLNDRSRL
jgi:hypothetical protein